MTFSLTFVASGANDPQVLPPMQDGTTEAAYDFDGVTFVLRIGLTRPNGYPVPLVEVEGEHEVVTIDGLTWNRIQFDPDPADLLTLLGGSYPADLITQEVDGEDQTVEDQFDTGTVRIVRGASE